MKSTSTLDMKLNSLVEYRQFDCRALDEYRNLLQVVAHLDAVNKHLDPAQAHSPARAYAAHRSPAHTSTDAVTDRASPYW